MGALKERFRHAFAVDPPGAAEPTAEQQEPVDFICRWVAKRHLTTPGLLLLEMSRPYNFLAAQFMHALAPAVWALSQTLGYEKYQHFIAFLEHRGSTEYLAERIEQFEEELSQSRRSDPPGITPPAEPEEAHDED